MNTATINNSNKISEYIQNSNIFKIWSKYIIGSPTDGPLDFYRRHLSLYENIFDKKLLKYNYFFPIVIGRNRLHLYFKLINPRTEYSYDDPHLLAGIFYTEDDKLSRQFIINIYYYNCDKFSLYVKQYGDVKTTLLAIPTGVGTFNGDNHSIPTSKELESNILNYLKDTEKIMVEFLNFGTMVGSFGFLRRCGEYNPPFHGYPVRNSYVVVE